MGGDRVLIKLEPKETKRVIKDELCDQFQWFYKTFFHATQAASNEFFGDRFSFKLMSISKNINVLFQGDEYFVTKIRIDKQHDVFFRCSSDAVKILLEDVLGENRKFTLSKITELEAKIISSFNDYIFSSVVKFLLPPPPKGQKRKNFDTVHLTFFVNDKLSEHSAKLIVSLPQVLLDPKAIKMLSPKIDVDVFTESKIDVKIKIGTTKFILKELKNLEKEDIVVFEDSNINKMKLVYEDYKKDFKLTPNPGLITTTNGNDNGGNNMEDKPMSQSLWDNITVEMGAEFDKVKISLGELKAIEQGLVVDIASVYDNKVSLKVENKTIANGELVIINDRYGVRINEVFANEKAQAQQHVPQQGSSPDSLQPAAVASEGAGPMDETEIVETDISDEEFDYSDFELDDQDI